MRSELSAVSHTCPAPSPDGSRIAWISDRDGRPAVYVAALPVDGAPVVADDPLHIGGDLPDVTALAWSPDGRWLACQVAPAGGERTRVVLVDPDGPDRREIAPAATAVVFGVWSPTGRAMGVTLQSAGRADGVACLVDVRDGSSTVLASGVAPQVCAVGGHRAVVRTGPRGARRLELVDLRRGRRTELVSGATVADARFGPAGTLLLHTDAGREHPALLSVTPDERGDVSLPRVVAARSDQDLDVVALAPGGARAALVWNDGGTSRLELADPRGGHRRALPAPAAVVTGVSFTRDGAALLVAGHDPDSAPHVTRLDLGTARSTPLLASPVAPAVTPRTERFTAEDGLDLRGWLLNGGGSPGPTMVWLHGGPESEERPGFAPLLQWLAAAGVTVFAPNVRGSSGRGRTFTRADDGARRGFSITDVRAAVDHLVSAGIADPRRVAVGGRSYGGFLALAALTRFPELFAAGVDVCGMSDLEAFHADTEPWISAAAVPEYGDPAVDATLLRSLSPIHDADRIAAPLLVVHGAHDTNVPVDEARRIVEALERRGAAVELALYADEGHEIHDRHTRARFVLDTGRWVLDALGAVPAVRSG